MKVRFSLLGPLEIFVNAIAVQLDSRMVKAALATLLLADGRVVSGSILARSLWDVPPKSAPSNLRSYLARLRKAFRSAHPQFAERLVTVRGQGDVQLRVESDEFDAMRFVDLAGRGHTHLVRGEHQAAATLLREALDLWHGPAGQGLVSTNSGALRHELANLDERRLTAHEDYIDVRLSIAEAGGLLGEVRALTVNHPLRERPWEQLMRVLYFSGDPAGALKSYHDAQRAFKEMLGIDPSPRLHALQQAVLRREDATLLGRLNTAPVWARFRPS